jgi:hypothetical protein
METLALLALGFLFSGKKGSSSSSSSSSRAVDVDSEAGRFVAGDIEGTIYSLPRPSWRITRGGTVVDQGTGPALFDVMRPMLESFAAKTEGRSVVAYIPRALDNGLPGIVTLAVFPVGVGVGESWAWTITDGAQAANGFAPTRGAAILAAMDRALNGGD